MANNLESNITRKVLEVFVEDFESERVLSKNVDTQMLDGKFDTKSGDTVDFQRPTRFRTVTTPDGDMSAETPSDIIAGKASGVVQDYRTALVDFTVADEAIKMGNLSEKVIKPIARQMKVDLELDFSAFMRKNAGLMSGTYGTAMTSWADVSRVRAVMTSLGVPSDEDWNLAINPYTETVLANQVRSLGAGGVAGEDVSKALKNATLAEDYAGMRVLAAATLDTMTTHSVADRVGTLSANPDVTYVTAKDTMKQTLAVSGFGANLQIRAGEMIQIPGRYRLNLSTRKPVVDDLGAKVLYTAVVTADVTLSGTGTGNIVVAGPAIFEATGAYSTVEAAPISGDVVTLLGAASTLYQPNLFWHKKAFSLGFVKIPRLSSTDSFVDLEDGLHMRVSMGSDFLKNKNKIRVDMWPAYSVLDPFKAGQGWG